MSSLREREVPESSASPENLVFRKPFRVGRKRVPEFRPLLRGITATSFIKKETCPNPFCWSQLPMLKCFLLSMYEACLEVNLWWNHKRDKNHYEESSEDVRLKPTTHLIVTWKIWKLILWFWGFTQNHNLLL